MSGIMSTQTVNRHPRACVAVSVSDEPNKWQRIEASDEQPNTRTSISNSTSPRTTQTMCACAERFRCRTRRNSLKLCARQCVERMAAARILLLVREALLILLKWKIETNAVYFNAALDVSACVCVCVRCCMTMPHCTESVELFCLALSTSDKDATGAYMEEVGHLAVLVHLDAWILPRVCVCF